MAQWRRTADRQVPTGLARFDPEVWGDGEAGVRAWKRACIAWLDADPDRTLPVGRAGNQLDVLREAVRLLSAL